MHASASGRLTRPLSSRQLRRIGILVVPDYSHLGIALLIEPLSIANWLAQSAIYEWTILSVDGQPVRASNGVSLPTQPVPEQAGRFSTIFVVASFEPKIHCRNRRLKMWLQRESRFGAQIGGIETGTEMLAAAALLNGRHAAVHWDNLEGFQETYPKVRASTQLYTIEPRIITCAGALAISDMMLAWIAQTREPGLANEILQHLLHPRKRADVEDQFGEPRQEGPQVTAPVAAAIRLMQQSMAAPLSCEDIAAAVGLSQRQLERQFKQCTSVPPLQYYVRLRVSTAHKLLQQTELSVSQVAAATGFESLEHFSRVYKTRFGLSPSRDRAQSRAAPVMRHALFDRSAVVER